MQIGYLGLGKMGKNMVLRLLEKGHDVVAWNRSPEPRQEVASAGATTYDSVSEVIKNLTGPKTVWLMLPAGEVTNTMVSEVLDLLEPGDTLIEGANSHYKDTLKNAQKAQAKNVHFLGIGVSGGPGGALNGACLMIGGEEEVYKKYENLFKDLAAPNAYQFFAGPATGHFVKMVHNGIEYGMMQAIAEGFTLLKESPFNINLQDATKIYNNQSVIESRLVGWLASGYKKHGQELTPISGKVDHKGEGKWTVETAQEMNIPVLVIADAFQFRLDSQQNPSYTGKVVSVLRNEFGGHSVTKSDLAHEENNS